MPPYQIQARHGTRTRYTWRHKKAQVPYSLAFLRNNMQKSNCSTCKRSILLRSHTCLTTAHGMALPLCQSGQERKLCSSLPSVHWGKTSRRTRIYATIWASSMIPLYTACRFFYRSQHVCRQFHTQWRELEKARMAGKGSHGGIYLGFFVFPTVLQSRGGELSSNECTLMQTALPPNVFTGLQHSFTWPVCTPTGICPVLQITRTLSGTSGRGTSMKPQSGSPLSWNAGCHSWASRLGHIVTQWTTPKQATSTPVLFVHTTHFTYWSRMQAPPPLNSVENPAFCAASSDVETSPNAPNDIPREKAVASSADRMSPLHRTCRQDVFLGAAPEWNGAQTTWTIVAQQKPIARFTRREQSASTVQALWFPVGPDPGTRHLEASLRRPI